MSIEPITGRYLTVDILGAPSRIYVEEAGQGRPRLSQIDTAKTPVHIIVGAYHLTCTPEDAAPTAKAVPGATLAVMDKLGHFPMSEHPTGFRPFFLQGLAKMPIAAG